ncbi:universal stress protein [Aquimarina gracilis]|uniref:Universal stress protein n=1 Tax=Aquimarina gracilis TaxID=874422 RepID=A0ABU5ZST7_9FLAO|nr:universal stress protein [Aquimarina gracilis]MEB3345043.1 universal stress protein [Aquimarina gracilis]
MKKKILLPTDFSQNAWNAIEYATELYKNETCDFYILNAFNASGYALESMMVPEPGEKLYEEAKEKSEQGLSKILERLSFRNDEREHKFFMVSQFNGLLDAIKDIVDKQDIEMIIMGTKGSSNAVDVIFGSNTVMVMEKSRNCPVMAIPEDATYKDLEEIVFPTDYKMNFKRRELQNIIEVAKMSKAAIRVLYASDGDPLSEEQENNQNLLKEYFEGLTYTFHTLTNLDAPSAVRCFVESRESDMIAFFNRKHSFFGSIFSKPMVKSLGRYAKVPVLAIHDLRG